MTRLGEKLYSRVGRKLILMEVGKVVCRYSEGICSLGGERSNMSKGYGTQRPIRLVVGIADGRLSLPLVSPFFMAGMPVLAEQRFCKLLDGGSHELAVA